MSSKFPNYTAKNNQNHLSDNVRFTLNPQYRKKLFDDSKKMCYTAGSQKVKQNFSQPFRRIFKFPNKNKMQFRINKNQKNIFAGSEAGKHLGFKSSSHIDISGKGKKGTRIITR